MVPWFVKRCTLAGTSEFNFLFSVGVTLLLAPGLYALAWEHRGIVFAGDPTLWLELLMQLLLPSMFPVWTHGVFQWG